MPVLYLEVLDGPIIVTHSRSVLVLPLLGDLLLLDHHGVGLFFMCLVPLFLFENHVLQVCDLEVTLIGQLVHPTVMDDLLPVKLSKGSFLLVTQLVSRLA